MGIFSFFGRRLEAEAIDVTRLSSRLAEQIAAQRSSRADLIRLVLTMREQVRAAQRGLNRLQRRNKRNKQLRLAGKKDLDGQNHYAGCWAEVGHHACAIARIRTGPDGWSVEEAWKAYLERQPKGVQQNVKDAMDSGSKSQTRDAFLAGVKVAAHESKPTQQTKVTAEAQG